MSVSIVDLSPYSRAEEAVKFSLCHLMPATLLALILPDLAHGAEPPRSRDEAIRQVRSAIVQAARRNQQLPQPRQGDALTIHYLQEAARAASLLPPEDAVPACLLGLGIALDTSSMMRQNLLTGPLWRRVEDEASRQERLGCLGRPTLYGRHDWAQHFFVSAALSALVGEAGAESLGMLKEQLDTRPGGSGFSFADLAADYAGVALAGQLLRQELSLLELSRGCRIEDLVPRLTELAEGLGSEELSRKLGSFQDPRFLAEVARIRRSIRQLPTPGEGR